MKHKQEISEMQMKFVSQMQLKHAVKIHYIIRALNYLTHCQMKSNKAKH